MFASGDVNWAKECVRRVKLLVEHRGKLNYDVMLELFTKPDGENYAGLPVQTVSQPVQCGIRAATPTVRRIRRITGGNAG